MLKTEESKDVVIEKKAEKRDFRLSKKEITFEELKIERRQIKKNDFSKPLFGSHSQLRQSKMK